MKKTIAWKLLLGAFLGQSQRRIYPGTSNHGISPNDSVNTVVDPSKMRN